MRTIREVLKEFNFLPDVYAVGGCVRDFIMGIKPKDIDLATSSTPEEIIALCTRYSIPTVPTGVKYGTVTAILDGVSYEITTFRSDHNTDGRHADVKFLSSITDDLARRDFTINAMAFDGNMNLIDPFGGLNDIRNCIIKTVNIPRLRFTEDYLRIIRAARFAARFGFTIDTGTFNCMRINADLVMPNVSVERIKMEFDKAFESPNAGEFFSILYEIGFIDEYLPEYAKSAMLIQNPEYHPEGSVKEHIRECLNRHGSWAVLLHDIGKPFTAKYDDKRGFFTFYGHDAAGANIMPALTRRIKLSNQEAQECLIAAKYHMRVYTVKRPPKIRRMVLELEKTGLKNWRKLLEIVSIADNHRGQFPQLPELPNWPSGEEIASILGCSMPNKQIGQALHKIQENWISTGNVLTKIIDRQRAALTMQTTEWSKDRKTIVIMRGVPGSGKSTAALKLRKRINGVILSADDFFKVKQEYEYNDNFIAHAHRVCKAKAEFLLAQGYNVIIDNTNTRLFEMRDYVKMAQDYDYTIEFITCTYDGKNVHGVTDEKVQQMKNRWEDFNSLDEILNSKAPWEEKKEVAA